VLLVEGDVRQTTITDLLDVDSRLGLADVLADPRGLYDAIAPSGHAGMWVLGANVPAQPRHHLTTAQLDEMMQKLYGHFDRIVVLGPPALVAAESAILASVVDATVLVVSAGKATTDDVEGARENLESVGGHVVGVVLTDLPVPRRTRAAAAAYRDRVSEPGSLVLRANRP
jgi:Mrp family chromosome partitioning ATPase